MARRADVLGWRPGASCANFEAEDSRRQTYAWNAQPSYMLAIARLFVGSSSRSAVASTPYEEFADF